MFPGHQLFCLMRPVVLRSHRARRPAPSAQLFFPQISPALLPGSIPLLLSASIWRLSPISSPTPIGRLFSPYIRLVVLFSGILLREREGSWFPPGSFSGIARGSPFSALTSLAHVGSRVIPYSLRRGTRWWAGSTEDCLPEGPQCHFQPLQEPGGVPGTAPSPEKREEP